MTLQEFKNWFDGFQEGISCVPNKKQWARICERIAEIDGNVTTEIVFRERYWWQTLPSPQWIPYTVGTPMALHTVGTPMALLGGQPSTGAPTITGHIAQCGFNPLTAFHNLGWEDARAITKQRITQSSEILQ